MFKKYSVPKIGLFSVESASGNYCIQTGWEQTIKPYTIIAENELCYIYEFRKTSSGTTVIGIHKSRLQKWLSGQLSIDF